MNNKILNYIFVSGIFVILFLPLVSLPPVFHPPAWIQEIIFRTIFSVLLFLFLYQALLSDNSKIKFLRNTLTNKKEPLFALLWSVVVLLVLIILSTIFSVDINYSIWSSPQRSGGAVSFILLFLFCIFSYLTLKGNLWNWALKINILVGVLASILGVMQKFAKPGDFILSYSDRVVSTFGGSIFFALYLSLLIFISISFIFAEKRWKKYLYLATSILFLFAIFLTGTRAGLLGFGAGIMFFVFFYPLKTKWSKITKIAFLFLIALSIIGVSFLKTQPELIQSLKTNKFYGSNFTRLWNVLGNFSLREVYNARASGWSVITKGIIERPLLGWGPENVSVAFDKHYDSKLPGLLKTDQLYDEVDKSSESTWWDKGHSFIIDYAATMGIPFLLVYLFFNIFLLYKLNQAKKILSEDKLWEKNIIHGAQAGIIAYLVTDLTSFDTFPTYLLYFFIVSFCLYIINRSFNREDTKILENKTVSNTGKKIFLSIIFIILIWFVWSFNLKLIPINKDVNYVSFLYARNAKCEQIMPFADKLLAYDSILNNYIHLNYIDAIGTCIASNPKNKLDYSYKGLMVIEKSIKERPLYTRNWLFQGAYAYAMIGDNPNLSKEDQQKLIDIAYRSFEKTKELSPGRQTTYMGWAKLDMALNNYAGAKQKADECISLNPDYMDCWWLKVLVYLNAGDTDEGTKTLKYSLEKSYFHNPYSEDILNQLVNGYSGLIQKGVGDAKEYYQILKSLYKQLVAIDPENFQYRASLAYIYKQLGEYDNARQEALKVIELSPASRQSVEAFLKTLPQ